MRPRAWKPDQMTDLDREIARRDGEGSERLTVAAMGARFLALGYRLDRSLDCACVSRIMTGPNAGETYPTVTTGVKEADTGRSAFNRDARRDARFNAMQALRGTVYAVTRGRILEA